MNIIKVYTDGSCHTQLTIGAWAAIIFFNNSKEIIKGWTHNTTHNQMELWSVIQAIEHITAKNLDYEKIEIYSDSQYVTDLPQRKQKLEMASFLTKTGKAVQNTDLLKTLINYLELYNIELIKVPSHQKKGSTQDYNREVDIIVRKTLREEVKKFEFIK